METKNLKSIEWLYDEISDTARLRITTKETNRPRVFAVYAITTLEGYTHGMDVYNDWALLESSCCYKSLISVFTAIADMLDCDFAELADALIAIDKMLA